ncbi:DUF4382 domain-containing protein [Candidatus Micrarchaeota archaeon]|nr:DUF4382 domain-containing protein [Candidatus Micrarchaeota archaeon]
MEVNRLTTLLLVTVFSLLILFGCAAQGSASVNTTSSSGSYSPPVSSSSVSPARLIVSITDAAARMGSVSSVELTVDKVYVHSSTDAWIEVSSSPATYDLLLLKNSASAALLANASLPAGSYDQVRLEVSSVVVTDSNGRHEAKVPSNRLQIKSDLTASVNSTSTISLDFLVDRSLHTTGRGEYIFAPVVDVQTRNGANVSLKGTNVIIEGGSIVTNLRVGTDTSGRTDVNVSIPTDAILEINGNNIMVRVVPNGSRTDVVINSSVSNVNATRVNATIDVGGSIVVR